MKKLKKFFSLVFVFALMLGLEACEKDQQRITLTVKDEQGNFVTNNNLYIIDTDNVKTKITTPMMGDYYILIQKTDENGQVIDEEVKEINEAVEYEIKGLPKDEMVTFNLYTALTINGDDAKIKEDDDLPSFRFALKNSPKELQAMRDEQAQKEAEQEEQSAEFDRESYAIGLFSLYVARNSNVKLKSFRGDFNVATQNFGDTTSYIVTYKDKDNPRIKLIFSWDGDTSKDLEDANFDPWYYLENGDEKFNELDAKRDEALNNQ